MASAVGSAQYYSIIFILFLISTLILRYLLKKQKKPNLRLPPSPPALPVIGHLHLLRPVVTKCFPNLSSKYGPLLYLHLGSRPLLLVSSPFFAADIFRRNDVVFASRPKTPFHDWLLFGNFSFLAAPYGDYWRFIKKLCVTELLGTRQLETSHGVRREEIRRFLERLAEKASKYEHVDLGHELMKLTNNIICRMVMSTRCSEEDDEAEKCRELVLGSIDLAGKLALATMLGPLKKLGFWINRKQLKDITTKYDELLDKILKEHEDRGSKDCDQRDLMDILIHVYQDQDAEFKITKDHIKAFLMDLFIGGTDTSADTMKWLMAELMNHPNVLKKLREEIESVVGTKRLVEESDIPNLHYLQAVVKETLRLYPAVPLMPRECREDCKIGEFDIPKDTAVMINAYSIMRDPKIWENPNQFYPERFLESPQSQERQNFNFIPFGGGRRLCPGMNLAFSVIHISVASMVQCFDWKFVGDGNIDMQAKPGWTMCLANPLLCLPVLHFNPCEA